MSKRRQSMNITHAELINMVALLRGSVTELLGFIGTGDDDDTRRGVLEAQHVLKQTTFDVSLIDETPTQRRVLWHQHPHDVETFVAQVPGGCLVRIIEVTDGIGRTTAVTFVPNVLIASFGIKVPA